MHYAIDKHEIRKTGHAKTIVEDVKVIESYKSRFSHEDLENLTEEIVFEQIYKIQQEEGSNIPTSDVALQDIAAIALNNVPPKYICNFMEKHNPHKSLIDEVNSLRDFAHKQVLKAIKIVRDNPHD